MNRKEPEATQKPEDTNLLINYLVDILSHVQTAVAIFETSGQCTFCTPQFVELFDVKPKNVDDFISALSNGKDSAQNLRSTIESAQESGGSPPIEIIIRNRDNVKHVYLLNALMLGEGDKAELAVVLTEHSEQMNWRNDLQQIGHLAALGQITAGVAHEFNNILTSVLGWTQIARQNLESSSTVSSALEIIESNAHRANEIASRLLGVSQPTQNPRHPISMIGVIEGVLEMLSWEMNNLDVTVVRSFQDEGICVGDENRLGQVFINLMRNAMDAMPNGGTLNISIGKKGDRVEVSLGDTGPGMSKEVLKRVFDPFFTTKKRSDEKTSGGSGIGLFICQEILELFGGEINVESAPGQGTRFIVRLRATEKRSIEEKKDVKARTSIPPGTTVLVADDEPDIGEMVRTALELKGANVVTVNSGNQAVDLAKKRHFDAAFIDFSMPGLSGNSLGREILDARPQLPIIFMSGREVEIDNDVHVADFLKKPFNLDDIKIMLCQVLKTRR